jgi:4-amino-4-deoxy-L-arabinose transferase-like glycosyltransferase
LWFALLGHRDLMDPDEGRYARIPQEMLASGDWITPRLNGYKYFEKPSLQYWLTAASFAAFGETNAAARLPVAVIGFAGALWVWLTAARLFGRDAGLLAFLFTLSSFLYAALGHVLSLDMAVTVFLTVGIGALLLAQIRRDEPRLVRAWMLVGWAALGLAVMSKGLIGLVLPAGALVFYSLWQRDWTLWRSLHIGKGLAIFLIVAAPWFLLVSLQNPAFPRFFVIHEHLDRYLTDVHQRDEPWWYLLVWLLVGSVPWLVHFVRALLRPSFPWRRGDGSFDPMRFLWVYTVFVLAFFSAGHSMLPTYVLPVFPALAIMAARQSVDRPLVRPAAAIALGLSVLLFIGVAFALAFASRSVRLEYLEHLRPWLAGAAAALAAGGAAARYWHGSTREAILLLSLATLLGFQLVNWGAQAFSPSRSGRAVAQAVRPYVQSSAELFAIGLYVHSLSFYLRRSLTLVDYRGEMAFGIEQAPARPVLDLAAFEQCWRAARQAVAVIEPSKLASYEDRGLPLRVIYSDPRKVAVIKP